ncbi:cytochrome P450 [Kitasatospora sp. NPDC057692]|uniref:cytochrome P450 n=1 Tax=Kitasatospora sp. NPDC057692 TaxID=3346215 RepID=UPI0036849A1A
MDGVAHVPLASRCVPLLGHVPALMRDPLSFVASLPAQGELVRLRLGPRSVVMVCDPDLLRYVLVHDEVFDKGGPLFERLRDVLGNGLGTCPYSLHRRQRRLCRPAFDGERFPGYAAVMADLTDEIVDSWRDGWIIDVPAELTTLTARIALATMFSASLPASLTREMLRDLDDIMTGLIRQVITPVPLARVPTPSARRYWRAREHLRGSVEAIIAARRHDGNGHDDLLGSLMAAHDPGTSLQDGPVLSDEELADQAVTFFVTGADPVSSTISFALALLAHAPDVERRLHEEVDRVRAEGPLTLERLPSLELAGRVIAETLRLYPPGWLFTRALTVDSEIGAVRLPAGTMIAYSPYLIHRRPDLFEAPDAFRPDRWRNPHLPRNAYLPFGAGARRCIGEYFARTEAALTLAGITARWRLVPVTDRPVRCRLSTTLRPAGLRMRLVERS